MTRGNAISASELESLLATARMLQERPGPIDEATLFFGYRGLKADSPCATPGCRGRTSAVRMFCSPCIDIMDRLADKYRED